MPALVRSVRGRSCGCPAGGLGGWVPFGGAFGAIRLGRPAVGPGVEFRDESQGWTLSVVMWHGVLLSEWFREPDRSAREGFPLVSALRGHSLTGWGAPRFGASGTALMRLSAGGRCSALGLRGRLQAVRPSFVATVPAERCR